MQRRSDHDRAFAVIREVIHEWDPYALILSGALSDEWDSEIASLVAQIPRIRSAGDAIHAVSRVFTAAFEPEGFGVPECTLVGTRLYEALAEARLLAASSA